MTDGAPLVSIVVDAREGREAALRAGEAAAASAGSIRCEVIAGEGGPSRASAWNEGARAARGAHLAFLHADAAPEPGWLAPLLEVASVPGGAVAGSRLVLPDGSATDGILLAYARPYPLTAVAQPDTTAIAGARAPLDVPAVSGAAMLLPGRLLEELGGFDDAFAASLEDVDLCLRAAAASRAVKVARASRTRHAGTCAGSACSPDPDALLLSRRWLGKVPLLDPDALRRKDRARPRPGRPPLSIVVPARDAALALPRTAEALLHALGPGDELIVADGGSTDGTREYAELLARDAPGAVRVLKAASREEAARAGLASARRADAALLHPGGPAAPGLLDDTTQLLEVRGDRSLVALGTPFGTCVVGPTENLVQVPPEAFFAADPAGVDAASERTALVIR